MKKLLATVLALLSISSLLLTGCGGSSPSSSTPAAGSGAADGTVYTLKWAHVSPASGDKQADAILEMIDKIKEESSGRLIIEHYPASTLGNEEEIYEGIQMGTIELGTLSCGSLTGFVPELAATTIPFLFQSREEAWDFFDSETADWLAQKVYDKSGIKVMGWAENGLRCFSSAKKPIHSPDDLAGMKVRTQNNPVTMAMVTALGGSPQPIAFAELYTALQQGAVDAQENPASLIYTQGLYEVTPYLTLDYHVYDFLGVFMNEGAFNKLPADLQEILAKNIDEFVVNERAKSRDYDARDIQSMKDKGVTVHELTDEEYRQFVDKTSGVADEVRKIAGDEAVTKVLEQVQQLRGN